MHQQKDKDDQVVRVAHIARDLAHLPGAATPDWCQRAAATFARHDPTTRAWVAVIGPSTPQHNRPTESIGFAKGAEAQSSHPPQERLAAVLCRGVLETLPDLELPGVVSGDRLLELATHPIRGITHLRRHTHILAGVAEVEPLSSSTPSPRLLLIFWDRPPEPMPALPLGRARRWRKQAAPDDLRLILRSVLRVARDRLCQAIGNSDTENPWLSVCEQRVLDMLVAGMSVRQIAEVQSRSPHTVHDHVKRLYAKLGTNSRGALLAR
ncbi:hypothetical protein MNBD_PLANCTO03-81, partial [hydrothermal vent metagenome]